MPSRCSRDLAIGVLCCLLVNCLAFASVVGMEPSRGGRVRWEDDGEVSPARILTPPSMACSIVCRPASFPAPGALVPLPAFSPLFVDEGTFEAWVQPNQTLPGLYHPVFARHAQWGFGTLATLGSQAVAFFFQDIDGGAWQSNVTDANAVQLGVWSHIAVSFRATTVAGNSTGGAKKSSYALYNGQRSHGGEQRKSGDGWLSWLLSVFSPSPPEKQSPRQRSRSSRATADLNVLLDTTTYINGVAVAAQQFNFQPSLPAVRDGVFTLWTNNRQLANTSTYLYEYWYGSIAEVRVWNRSLSGDEIQANMALTLNAYTSNLTGYWPSNDCQGIQVADYSVNNLTATIVGGDWNYGDWPPVNFSCPNSCSGNAASCTASNGSCVCLPGWTGPDCSTPVCTPDCVPGHGQCVVVNQSGTCVCDGFWHGPTCNDILITNGEYAIPDNTSCDRLIITSDASASLLGALYVASNATIAGTLFLPQSSTAASDSDYFSSALILVVNGWLYVTKSGVISATAASDYTPLFRYPTYGSYGGWATNTSCPLTAAQSSAPCTNTPYGDFVNATRFPGAAASSASGVALSGGIVDLLVGSLYLDGVIEANGAGNSSGGSIGIAFLLSPSSDRIFEGNGTVSASASPLGGGSGGRVAVAGFSSIVPSLDIVATGGQTGAAPGTIYLEQLTLTASATKKTSRLHLNAYPNTNKNKATINRPDVQLQSMLVIAGNENGPTTLYPTVIDGSSYYAVNDLVVVNALVIVAPGTLLNVSEVCLFDQASIDPIGLLCNKTIVVPVSTATTTTTTKPTTTTTTRLMTTTTTRTTTTTKSQSLTTNDLIEIILTSVFGFLLLLGFVVLGFWFYQRNRRKTMKSRYGKYRPLATHDDDVLERDTANRGSRYYPGAGMAVSASSPAYPVGGAASASSTSLPMMATSAGGGGPSINGSSGGEHVYSPAASSAQHSHSNRSYRKLHDVSGETLDNALSGYEIDFRELQIIHPPIAKGGFGVVNRALYKGTNVAVKTLFEHLGELPLEEFCREIRALGRIHHPNIVLLMGACRDPLCIVTEFAERGSLFDVIHRHPEQLVAETVTQIVQGAICGMSFLHAQTPPILHRDLKSANILITKMFEAKIADFGLSRQISTQANAYSQSMTRRIGTTRWTAPEVLVGSTYTEKSDVYSFGMILYEIFSLQVPYHEEMWDSKVEDLIIGGQRPEIPINTPDFYKMLIEACWMSPTDRPSFAEMGLRLSSE